MSNQRQSAKAIFLEAVENLSAQQWPKFLDQQCGDDQELRKRVEKLLAAHQQAASLFDADPADGEAVTMPPADRQSAPPVIGPYKLLQQIGEGGMGAVWMAQQEKPVRRRVALKLIRPDLGSKEIIARFEAERQALAMMNHPNIARVLDAGTTETGSPYFVMELVNGIPLNEFCDQNKLSIRGRLELFVPICNAIQHAHQKGIIHRDLKPSNVLVTLEDGKPLPKVIDFGLAKALEHTQKLTDKTLFTEFGKVVGTVQYMSPEQAEMNVLDVDTRTDIYSLGVMLYELLTGSTPIEKESLHKNALLQVLAMIRETDPPLPSMRLSSSGDKATGISEQRKITPSKLGQILRGELDWVVMKAIDKDRARRYETASAFADDIDRYLNDDAVVARPPTMGYKVSKFVKKHRSWVAAASTIAVLLVAGITGTSIGWYQTQIARTLADQKTIEVSEEKDRADIARDRAAEEAENARKAEAEASKAETEALTLRDQAEASLARTNYFLAIDRWDSKRVREAREFLEEVPPKYRNFEWRLAQRQFLGSDLTCYGQLGPSCVAFSPDGTQFASGGGDKTIKLWEVTSSRELRTLTGHTDRVTSVAFSPDGKQLVSSSDDTTIKLWDVATGNELRTLTAHSDSVTSGAFSPDGTTLASGSRDGTVKFWDVATGNELSSVRLSFTPGSRASGRISSIYCKCVAFSPDGTFLAAGSNVGLKLFDLDGNREIRTIGGPTSVENVMFSPDGKKLSAATRFGPRIPPAIKLWDAASGTELHTFSDQSNAVFSPDGMRLATGNVDNTIQIWDVSSGRKLRTLTGHSHGISGIAFSPDGRRLATSSRDNTVKIWNSVSFLKKFEKWHQPRSVAFSPDGILLATTGEVLKLYNMNNFENEVRTLGGENVVCVAFSDDSTKLASGHLDNTIKLWDVASGRELRTLIGHGSSVKCVAFSHDGQKLASGSKGAAQNGEYVAESKLWDVSSGRELRTFAGHRLPIESVALSPDGMQLATTSQEFIIKLWDVRNGDELHTLTGGGYTLTFSPDGTTLAAAAGTSLAAAGRGGDKNTIELWDVASGNKVRTFTGHSNQIRSFVFSADGSRLASSSEDNTIKLWDVGNGDELRTLAGQTITSLAFTSDDTRLATYGISEGTVRLSDAAPGIEVQILRGASRPATSVRYGTGGLYFFSSIAVSPDGTRLATSSNFGTTRLFDCGTGRELRTITGLSWGWPVNSVAFSADSKLLASGSVDKTVKLWDVASGNELRTLTGHSSPVNGVAFSPIGKLLATCSTDKTIKLWDLSDGRELRTLTGHTDAVNNVTFNGDGTRLASGSSDNTINLWDVSNGKLLHSLKGHSHPVHGLAFNEAGTKLASGSMDDTCKLWEVARGTELRTFTACSSWVPERGRIEPFKNKILVGFSPEGKNLITTSEDGTIKTWELSSGRELRVLREGSWRVAASSFGLALSSDGMLATGSQNSEIVLWDVISGTELRTITGQVDSVNCISFSPDSNQLATGSSDDKTVLRWNVADGGELSSLIGHTDRVNSVAYGPNGRLIATGSNDNTIKLWGSADGTELRSLAGHRDWVTSVAFSPDGTQLATGSSDNTIKLWNVASGTELQTLSGHVDRIYGLSFSPDGTQLASGSKDWTVKIWDLANGFELRTLNGHKDSVTSIEFSPDGTRLHSRDGSGQQIVWATADGKQLPAEEWEKTSNGRILSPDKRWLVTRSGNDVLLVDREFKNTPREKLFRQFKAKFKPFLHIEQAESAEKNENWYAATFHRAWLMKVDPNRPVAFDLFHGVYDKLQSEFAARNQDVSLFLQPIVVEMLKLPRGMKYSEREARNYALAIFRKIRSQPEDKNSPSLTESELSQFRQFTSEHANALNLLILAQVEYRMGNFEEAIQAASKGELVPDSDSLSARFFVLLAKSHYKLGDTEKANLYREKLILAIKLDANKDNRSLKSMLAEVDKLLGSQEKDSDDDGN